MAKLLINEGKGLRFEFDNGYKLSIQIGPGNYCDNRDANMTKWLKSPAAECQFESSNAEIAVFKGGAWCNPSAPFDVAPFDVAPFDVIPGGGTDEAGWVPINEVLDLINAIRALPE